MRILDPIFKFVKEWTILERTLFLIFNLISPYAALLIINNKIGFNLGNLWLSFFVNIFFSAGPFFVFGIFITQSLLQLVNPSVAQKWDEGIYNIYLIIVLSFIYISFIIAYFSLCWSDLKLDLFPFVFYSVPSLFYLFIKFYQWIKNRKKARLSNHSAA